MDTAQPDEHNTLADNGSSAEAAIQRSSAPFFSRWVVYPTVHIIRWLDAHNGLLTALASLAIAALTYFVAVYASGQLKVMSNQLDEMRATSKQTDGLIAANQKLADAAAKQAQAIESQVDILKGQLNEIKMQTAATKAQLKATMKVEIAEHRVGNEGWYFTPNWENGGGTEAIDFTSWSEGKMFIPIAPSDFNYTDRPDHISDNISQTIPPGGGITETSVFLSANDIKKAQSGAGEFVIWGYSQYKDVFSGSDFHHVRWCFKIVPRYLGSDFGFTQYYFRGVCNSRD